MSPKPVCASLGELQYINQGCSNTPNTRGGTWLIKWLNNIFPSLVAIIYVQWIGAIMVSVKTSGEKLENLLIVIVIKRKPPNVPHFHHHHHHQQPLNIINSHHQPLIITSTSHTNHIILVLVLVVKKARHRPRRAAEVRQFLLRSSTSGSKRWRDTQKNWGFWNIFWGSPKPEVSINDLNF